MVQSGCLRYGCGKNTQGRGQGMSERHTLAVDIGGTGIKFAALDDEGRIVGERARVPTPPKPVDPQQVVGIIEETSANIGEFDRVSVGFPGMVRDGKVLTAPNLGTELWM